MCGIYDLRALVGLVGESRVACTGGFESSAGGRVRFACTENG